MASLGCLYCHLKMRWLLFLIFVKIYLGILTGIILNLYIDFGKVAIIPVDWKSWEFYLVISSFIYLLMILSFHYINLSLFVYICCKILFSSEIIQNNIVSLIFSWYVCLLYIGRLLIFAYWYCVLIHCYFAECVYKQ